LVLIYKQNGRIDVSNKYKFFEEKCLKYLDHYNMYNFKMSGQAGCNSGFLEPPRITDHDQLQDAYNLEVKMSLIYSRSEIYIQVCFPKDAISIEHNSRVLLLETSTVSNTAKGGLNTTSAILANV
jgi:hypothetical protein